MYATKFTKWLITDLIPEKSGKFPNFGKIFLPCFLSLKIGPKNEILFYFWQEIFHNSNVLDFGKNDILIFSPRFFSKIQTFRFFFGIKSEINQMVIFTMKVKITLNWAAKLNLNQ